MLRSAFPSSITSPHWPGQRLACQALTTGAEIKSPGAFGRSWAHEQLACALQPRRGLESLP